MLRQGLVVLKVHEGGDRRLQGFFSQSLSEKYASQPVNEWKTNKRMKIGPIRLFVAYSLTVFSQAQRFSDSF